MNDFNRGDSKRHMTLVEVQPKYDEDIPPVRIRATAKRDGVLYVKGHGPMDSGVMFILPALEEEEAKGYSESFYNIRINEPPELLKGGIGAMLKEAALLGGINLDHHYCTAFVKWLLPLDKRNKPNKQILNWAAPALHDEIRECKPKVIVCFGKPAFDELIPIKVAHGDALGGWFYSERYNARVILLDKPSILLRKPERLEDFRLYFREIKAMIDRLDGVTTAPSAPEMHFIETMADLRKMVDWWKAEKFKVFCTDCEWGKGNFLDRNLRSAQFAWSKDAGCAVCFLNERGEYIFDASYEEAGAVLCEVFNEPDVKFVGHYISVDLPWLAHLFGVEWYDKVLMDTAFAMQTCDESAGMGLEMLALTYTGFGRYDIPLMLWHKAHKGKDDEGFARIPDEILRPYSIYDVCVPMHALPHLQLRLKNENLERYYYDLLQPFVTNVFTHFVIKGLPIDIGRLDELRRLYQFARKELNARFQKAVAQESWMLLARRMRETGMLDPVPFVLECKALVDAGEGYKLCELAKERYSIQWGNIEPWLLHCAEAPQFNMQSKPQVVRWLFTCKGLTPIKSTDNKNTGVRSMPWEKVMELPPDRQKEYTPATDKQTLTILSEQAPILARLLELKDIENLCKAFLKEPQIDDETGEVTRENGLHYWLSEVDGRLHPFYSLTETGRPRAWRPNPLNIPSYVTDRIKQTIADLVVDLKRLGQLPEWAEVYLPKTTVKDGVTEVKPANISSIRSCIKAPEGWCIVESDDQTAEIRGLAYISGDKALMRLMDETDPLSGLILVGGKEVAIRLKYDTPENSGILLENQDPRCVMNLWVKSQWVREVSPDELLRNPDGTLIHPRYDLHWSLAEMVFEMPREKMDAKAHRGTGKVGNFQASYGASDNTLELKVESDTGKKPEKGTGKKILTAIENRQPDASDFLVQMENVPGKTGFYVAASGRRRRFSKHPDHVRGISGRTIRGHLSALGREARNFPMQESVAATNVRAGNNLLKFGRTWGLRGYPIQILYDSVVTLCPHEEREIWRLAHDLFMHIGNGWAYGDRILRYPIDHELNWAWSEEPPKDILETWKDPTFEPTPPRFENAKKWLEQRIRIYKDNPRLSVWNTQDLPSAV